MSKATAITATLIEGVMKEARAKAIPGAFYYYRDDGFGDGAGIIHSCPCGCGQLGALNLDPAQKSEGRPLWTNSGTREKPTLSPSVGIKKFRDDQTVEGDGYHWHGWLRNGVWESV